jgi:hypothetical protein
LPDSLRRSFSIPIFLRTLNPFGEIEIPAPCSLAVDDFSKIITGTPDCFNTHPSVNPEIPAPIIAIWDEKSFMEILCLKKREAYASLFIFKVISTFYRNYTK